MEESKIEEIITSLRHTLDHPVLYFGSDQRYDLATSYLYGLRHVSILLLRISVETHWIWQSVVEGRSHVFSARGIGKELEEEGMDAKQIVKELVEIEIAFWERIRDSLRD